MNHVLLRAEWLNGREHGMLRDLETEIVRQTGARVVSHPVAKLPHVVGSRIGHGMRFEWLRGLLPKSELSVDADVLWVPIQAPEDFQLDMCAGWDRKAHFRILIVFDAFPHQWKRLARIAAYRWDLMVTTFSEAIPYLSSMSRKQWHFVHQGVNLDRFEAGDPGADRPIFATSYGRNESRWHEALRAWCERRRLWYDYTVFENRLAVPTADHYTHYARMVRASAFSVAWGMERTTPGRCGPLSPITCRWFEIAASGALALGSKPRDPLFDALFYPGFVVELPDTESPERFLDALYERRVELHRATQKARDPETRSRWSWAQRVREILTLAEKV